MNYLILNGMDKEDSFIPAISKQIAYEFESHAFSGETINLNKKDIKPCLGCFKCWVQTPGMCIIDDYGREVPKKMIQSDVVVYLSPITFGGHSAELKKALDRSISLISPFFRLHHDEIHHETRYDKYPNLLAIGVLNEPDAKQEEIFKALIERNVLNNFSPKHFTQIIYHSDDESAVKNKIEAGIKKIAGGTNE